MEKKEKERFSAKAAKDSQRTRCGQEALRHLSETVSKGREAPKELLCDLRVTLATFALNRFFFSVPPVPPW